MNGVLRYAKWYLLFFFKHFIFQAILDEYRTGKRDGGINVQGKGLITAANVHLKAKYVKVDKYGRMSVDGHGCTYNAVGYGKLFPFTV